MAKRRSSASEYFAASPRVSGGSASHMVSVRLPEDLVQRLAEVGNEEGLSLSDTIRVVLERGLSAGKRRRSKK
jgi:metal-responsive CopG/Arc/MetJ family transcriptional regulator